MADIGNFEVVEEASPLILVNPKTGDDLLNDKDKPMTIYLYGLESKIAVTALKEIKSEDREGKKITDSEHMKRQINLLARCSDKFENLQLGGKKIDCSHKTATQLYTDYAWIFEQAAKYAGVRANHLGNSQKG